MTISEAENISPDRTSPATIPNAQPSKLPGGISDTNELLKLRALKFSFLYKNRIFQCMGQIFSGGISTIHWKSELYLDAKLFELLDLRAHKCFWNAPWNNAPPPPPPPILALCWVWFEPLNLHGDACRNIQYTNTIYCNICCIKMLFISSIKLCATSSDTTFSK